MIWKAPFVFSLVFSVVFSIMVLDRGEPDDLEADHVHVLPESWPGDHRDSALGGPHRSSRYPALRITVRTLRR